MIYIDPPYGIRFASNWQVSTKDIKVSDRPDDVTLEPEVIQAFRDTWGDGIHSYVGHLRERLSLARDLLTESGSIFVQIGDENLHLVRAVLDEIFGARNSVVTIVVKKKGAQKNSFLDPVNDYVLWYTKESRYGGEKTAIKIRKLTEPRAYDNETISEFNRVEFLDGTEASIASVPIGEGETLDYRLRPQQLFKDCPGCRLFRPWPITNGGKRAYQNDPVFFQGRYYDPPPNRCWSHTSRKREDRPNEMTGMERVAAAGRLLASGASLDFKRYLSDSMEKEISNWWDGLGGVAEIYVVQTNTEIVKRCMLMTTDPGDLVLDPTCGSGTTAYVAEQWGRRWITIDTSRVAMAIARSRLMAATFEYYTLRDSPEGATKEAELEGRAPEQRNFGRSIRRGFVYRRATPISSGLIANNAEIDVISEKWQRDLEPLRETLNRALGQAWEEWEIPREAGDGWPAQAKDLHARWSEGRRERQAEIDASIAKNAETEYLYDRPYEQKGIVRVTGPFTVESLSPHRVLPVDEEDAVWEELLRDEAAEEGRELPPRQKSSATPNGNGKAGDGEDDFVRVVLENLKAAGVQNTKKGERLEFTSLKPWPGRWVHAEGRYEEQGRERRAAIFVGPEYGTVTKADVLKAAREAADLFDVLIVCGFAFEAHVGDETLNLGRLRVLKARMNQDLRMPELKKTGAGNLFVVFGEPEIEVRAADGDKLQVEIKGVEVYDPNTDQVRTSGVEDIACWFIDTDYDQESFFVRHSYFLGGKDPYEKLKRALKAEIDEDAWATLHSSTSRPFPRPKSGQIAVKVINHYGDEVLKVYPVRA
jgi:adenine-specific DNA-methyltransferase